MNFLVKQIHKICQEDIFKEKIIVVDSHAVGNEMIQAYTNAGLQAVNLKMKTVHDLALEIVEMKAEKHYQYLDHTLGTHFIYNILKELKNKKVLSYFHQLEVTPSFSTSIYKTVNSIRTAGYSSRTLKKDAFISPKKADDLLHIMAAYEAVLATGSFMDDAAILETAIKNASRPQNKVFILQSHLSLTELEHQLLEKILPDTVTKLSVPKVYGAPIPETVGFRSIEWCDPVPFSYLYQLEKQIGRPDLSCFTAKTEETELKRVLELLKKSGTALDQSAIYYTKEEPYVSHALRLSERHQIPVTFGDGLSVSYSRPGKFVYALLKWMKDQYSVQAFIELMNEGLIEFPEEAPSRTRTSNLLHQAKVGWSPERYLTQLPLLAERYQQKETNADTAESKAYYQKLANDAHWLQQWFTRVFKLLPLTTGTIDYRTLLSGISKMLKTYCKCISAFDETAKGEMLEKIELLLPYAEETLPVYAAFEKVSDLFLAFKVNPSGPKPGHLHICSFKKGLYNNRTNTFIIGIDNRSFPGTPNEDPLLLDQERRKLSRCMPLLRQQDKENLYTMLQLMANCSGPVHISFCCFDIADNRTVSPSHLFLQGYRMITDNAEAEFKDVKALHSPLSATDVMEEKDYWNCILEKGSTKKLEDGLFQSWPHLVHGKNAEVARKNDSFTCYDGRVEIDAALYDPRQNKEQRMSAGKLEKLAACPYAYFLENILKLKPVEEVTFDPYAWLDPAVRGSMLHSVFEIFYKSLGETGEKPSLASHKDKIEKIAMEKITEQKAIQPPPSDRILQKETEDIFLACQIFLKEEEAYCEGYTAEHFEYTFGMDKIPPAEIRLRSGETIPVSGKIDRIDRSLDGYLHIIDYKTGSTYNYQESEVFKGGRQLQHFIYALAIEEHLKLEAGSVRESSYFFPSSKGLGERLTRNQDDKLRTNGQELLEKLVDILKHGHFSMTDDVNDCKFCDYKQVCRRDFYDAETLEVKQADQTAAGLKKFKGVRVYE